VASQKSPAITKTNQSSTSIANENGTLTEVTG
jgi:hypothetical protein